MPEDDRQQLEGYMRYGEMTRTTGIYGAEKIYKDSHKADEAIRIHVD